MSVFTACGPNILTTVLTLLVSVKLTANTRVWKTLYMDDESSCEVFVRNDDLEEGDMYIINSDSWHGRAPWARRPAECTINVNLGDRLVAVNLVEWWCDQAYKDPFLAVYDTCLGDRTNMLARYNCSNLTPRTIYSSGTCISFYHFRGHTRFGYFFSLELIGRYEVIAFPAGGIAALIVMSIVVIMVIVKIVCVVSGYEDRLPVIRIDPEDPKQTLLAMEMGGSQEGCSQENAQSSGGPSASGADDLATAHPSTGLPPGASHALLSRTHSSSSPGSSHQPAPSLECWDSDGMENYSPPRLKRYCSVRTSRILKL